MLNSTSLRNATTSFMVLALIITSAPGSAADSTETASEAASIAAMEQQIIAQLGRGTEQQEAKGTHPAVSVSSTEVSLDNTTLSLSSSDDPAAREGSVESHLPAGDDSDYLIRPNQDGAQIIFSIDSPDSDMTKDFEISGDMRLVSAADRGIDTGEVFVLTRDGSVHSSFEKPWAYDAEGRPVPTHFEVHGQTLRQVVEPPSDTAYPITADPDWKKVTTCAGTIIANAALYIVPGGIVARLLAKGNSIRKAATILVRTLNAKSYNNKLKALRNLGVSLGANLTGIGLIARACG